MGCVNSPLTKPAQPRQSPTTPTQHKGARTMTITAIVLILAYVFIFALMGANSPE